MLRQASQHIKILMGHMVVAVMAIWWVPWQ